MVRAQELERTVRERAVGARVAGVAEPRTTLVEPDYGGRAARGAQVEPMRFRDDRLVSVIHGALERWRVWPLADQAANAALSDRGGDFATVVPAHAVDGREQAALAQDGADGAVFLVSTSAHAHLGSSFDLHGVLLALRRSVRGVEGVKCVSEDPSK